MTRNTRPERMPVARVNLARDASQIAVTIYGEPAETIGTPLVELAGALEFLRHLTPAQAEELAGGLTLAARQARGEPMPPTALDGLLESRKNSRTSLHRTPMPLNEKGELPFE